MGNIHLVTGYKGEAHITSADQGAFNAAVFGNGQYVLEYGNQFSASVTSNNNIRVLDGEILMQGRHIRINPDEYVDLTISNGSQGMYRNDLIVARYTKNTSTGIEDCNLVVIEGTASSTAASDPAYTAGDILAGNATQNDMPLYRVPIDGINVGDLVPLFSTMGNFDSVRNSTITNDRLPVVSISKGGTNATTAAKALANLGAVNKAGDTMTGRLITPGGFTVYGDSWPTLSFTDSSDNVMGFVQVSSTNRLVLAQKGLEETYNERYMLPEVTEGRTAEGWYKIFTSKEPLVTTPAMTVVGSSPAYNVKNSSDGEILGGWVYETQNRRFYCKTYNADMDGADTRYSENYMFPNPDEGLTENKIYQILTTKDVMYGDTLPEAGTAGRIFFKLTS